MKKIFHRNVVLYTSTRSFPPRRAPPVQRYISNRGRHGHRMGGREEGGTGLLIRRGGGVEKVLFTMDRDMKAELHRRATAL